MSLPHLASRLFGTPLLVQPDRFEAILSTLIPRLQGQPLPEAGSFDGRRSERKPYQMTADGIAKIGVIGPLVKRASGFDAWCGGMTSYTQLTREIETAVQDTDVKGILLEVDSPGGEASGVEQVAEMIYNARSSKPVYAVAEDMACSAAYWIASAAEKLYVSRSGYVGSIGVVMAHADQSELNAKRGVQVSYIYAGAHKIDGNPHQPLSEDARSKFQAMVDGLYADFTADVAKQRGMSVAKVKATEADVFRPTDAIERGLADKAGTLETALADMRRQLSRETSSRAASAAGISSQEKRMEDVNADATAPEQKIQAETAVAQPAAEQLAEARSAGYASARQIVSVCALAGQPAQTALALLDKNLTPEAAQTELHKMRAEHAAQKQVDSHVMPQTGTKTEAKPEDSPLVADARRRAAGAGK